MKAVRCYSILALGVLLVLVGENNAKSVATTYDRRYCSILINGGLAEPQPLILNSNEKRKDFAYPAKPRSGHVVIKTGESIRLACPGSKLNLATDTSVSDTLLTCVGSNNYLVEAADIEDTIDNISCEKYPDVLIKSTGKRCGSNGVTIEIGFSLSGTTKISNDFYSIIDVCHDESLGNTLYAHAKILAIIDSAQKSFPRFPFRKANFFGDIPIAKVYGKASQHRTFAKILKSEDLADEYIQDKGNFFLSRGHLIAKADFVYGTQQRGTFFYVNAVPMWQNINAGNWATMEANVRYIATKRNLDLDTWVGGIGTLAFEDSEDVEQEIYLHVTKKEIAVPVPKILFKVVYSSFNRTGIVFITANNPFLDTLTDDYQICENVCEQIDYVTWHASNPEQGLSYCCEIDDFRKAYRYLPKFKTRSLLL